MWKPILLWLCLSGYCLAGPLGQKRNMPIIQRQEEEMEKESATAVANENDASKPEAAAPPNMLMISTLTLPSNATSIRADITDGFSCANKSYGYYADVDNDCQIFHVCLPVTYADGRENTFRWSFICPEETIFSQDSFTCMRREDMTIDCEESSKYYELNRNFGMTEEDENKHTQSNADTDSNTQLGSKDQETAMTTQVEQEKKTQQSLASQQQLMSDDKVEKLNSPTSKPLQMLTQKEKPMKVQKPNRRKPPTSSSSNKKKPTVPLRKVTQAVTVQPIIATTLETLSAEEETKPPRFTKRPSTLFVKEKLQPVKQSEPTAVRVELFNQKRKRPSIFNKKEVTTLKPTDDIVPITEQLATANDMTLPLVTQLTAETHTTEPTAIENTVKTQDLLEAQASETNTVAVGTALAQTSLSSEETKAIENKKISKPQPTEPEVVIQPEVTKVEKMPEIAPLEAIEEIPAVITEVEEINSNQKTSQAAETSVIPNIDSSETTSDVDAAEATNESIPTELHVNSPAIFQQNSEESLTLATGPSIEEMEEQRPHNAPETMPATSDMEHQNPIIEQMLSETDAEANQQTMGGFKPVDPAMAAEAEALIANFLNTLMKSDKTKNEPMTPTNDLINDKTENNNQVEDFPREQTSHETRKPEVPETDIRDNDLMVKTHLDSEVQGHTENIQSLPSMMMMMNNHPGEIFQIPVQVIQSPIEELVKVKDADADAGETAKQTLKVPDSPHTISIDDVVELVKDKLDQAPIVDKTEELPKQKPIETDESTKEDSPTPAEHSEKLILPIYHRVSSEPIKSNLLTANAQVKQPEINESQSSANISETKIHNDGSPMMISTNAEAKTTNIDRAQRARSIKTAKKMDPRKRRFLFKSDAS